MSARRARGVLSIFERSVLVLVILTHGDVVVAQTAAVPPGLSPVPQGSGTLPSSSQYVTSFVDPYTLKQYDRYLEPSTVPVVKWTQEEKIVKQLVPKWETQTYKTTETRYVPYVQYQTQPQVMNRWNPFGQPQVSWNYVPVTQYYPVNQVVDRPIMYQSYVEREEKIVVPKLVQETEVRYTYVDRERTSGSQVAAPQGMAATPLQTAPQIAMANRNSQLPLPAGQSLPSAYAASGQSYASASTYPYSPYVAVAASPWSAPSMRSSPLGYGYPSATYPPAGYSAPWGSPGTTPVVATANPSTYAAPMSYPTSPYGVASAPAFQWPSWTYGNGPLLRQDVFRQTSGTAMMTQPINGTIYPTSVSYPTVASQTSTGTLRPSTAPVMPYAPSTTPYGQLPASSYDARDPMQAGLPPTVLR